MPNIHKPNDLPLDPAGIIGVPAWMVPSFRIAKAAESGCRFNILIRAHGGVGDVICSEPAIRYAREHFKQSEVSLLTPYPELFRHLQFKEVWANPHGAPDPGIDLSKYLMFQTIDVTNELANEFVCHALMSGVDYASLNMWRLVLPNHQKRIILQPTGGEYDKARSLNDSNDVVLHPGKTWKSRTFPKQWWDGVIQGLIANELRPVIIGGVIDNGRASTVDVDTTGCLDLRSKQTLMETVAYLHLSNVLVTNDSSPLHMAATGNTHIGYLSTVKHADHLTHWRMPDVSPRPPAIKQPVYGWRMTNFSKGCLWEDIDVGPNNLKPVHVDGCEITDLLRWLPKPEDVVSWCVSRF